MERGLEYVCGCTDCIFHEGCVPTPENNLACSTRGYLRLAVRSPDFGGRDISGLSRPYLKLPPPTRQTSDAPQSQ